MAINYIEKGNGLHEKISGLGLSLWEENRVWKSSDDVAVQAIIDAYDPLPDRKKTRVDAIKAEGLARINDIFPAIKSVDEIAFYVEFWLSIKSTSRASTINFQKSIDIYTAAKAAISSVNSAVDVAGINAVVVAWPQ